MIKFFRIYFSAVLFLVSCNRTIRLSDEDYSWMPYKGSETLVFKSNTGNIDTIFFVRKDTLWGYPDPALSTKKYEEVAIFSKHSDAHLLNNQRLLENYFLKIKKTMSKKAELQIDLSAKDAKFYRLNSIKIDSLSNINPISFTTSYNQYNDVYIINAGGYTDSFQDRSNYVTKVYWSKSKGLIRYDKKNNMYWELTNKY